MRSVWSDVSAQAPTQGYATLPTPAMSPRPAIRPATEISSSSASQCRPIGLRVTAARWVGVACKRRGNHASGTPRVRPSDKTTHMLSSLKLTCWGEMVMVGSCNLHSPRFDHASQAAQGAGIQTCTFGQSDIGCHPKLCLALCPHDVNLDWFSWITLVRVDEKANAIMAENGWHWAKLRGILGCGNGGVVVLRLLRFVSIARVPVGLLSHHRVHVHFFNYEYAP